MSFSKIVKLALGALVVSEAEATHQKEAASLVS